MKILNRLGLFALLLLTSFLFVTPQSYAQDTLVVTAPGSYQDEVGCDEDWMPDCLETQLQPNDEGVYTYVTTLIPAGEYEVKAAIDLSWDVNYGVEGEAGGGNIPFTVPEFETGTAVTFTFDPATNILVITTEQAPEGSPTTLEEVAEAEAVSLEPVIARPDLVVIPGTIQSVAGCDGDWQPECEATALAFDEDDQLWVGTFTLPAGEYEYKAAINGSWDVNFGLNAVAGGDNISLVLEEETAVTFYFSDQTGWVTDDVNSIIANAPGNFQSEIGCSEDWRPDCLQSWLQDPDGDGLYLFQTTAIPAGDYEAKVAVGQSWDENYGEGGAPGGGNIPFTVPADDTLVTFSYDVNSNNVLISVGDAGGPVIPGNLQQRKAHWVSADTIAWNIDPTEADSFFFHYSPTGAPLQLSPAGVTGGESVQMALHPDGLSDEVVAKFPHLANYSAFTLPEGVRATVALKGQTAVSAATTDGPLDATGLQIAGVLDDLYTYDGDLGATFTDGVPTLRVWAPTARSVKLRRYDTPAEGGAIDTAPMRIDFETGVWSIEGEADWVGQYYLYEVEVYAPAENGVVTNLVTDPYAVSLSMNSQRSQIIDLNDPATKPEGWDELQKEGIEAPEDIVVYELHVRDFSVADSTVPAEHRGKYLAFTHLQSNGMTHLTALAEAGLTHLHLLPTFDIATIEEDDSLRQEVDFEALRALPANSEEQQALINDIRDADGFNWGYDPYHYNVPEGSYATDPVGTTRIVEYRQMVQALDEVGLYLVNDVVYNHTNSSGQADKSVLDKIVPGYYHRLNASGNVETSTCCQNTATEHNMMRKLMVDSVVLWAIHYKVDAFRFDLMGHHMLADMQAVRSALDALTLEEHGVDGKNIYVYGEGWNFGEVGDNARGINATQFNTAGTGIGTFNDRLRDAVRGGSPFGGQTEQGFINGLFYDPNTYEQGPEEAQLNRLLLFSDQIRIGLAGNLADYEFISHAGTPITGRGVDYNGQGAGYTQDPQENIIYISKHDNETLFDIIQYKAPLATSMEDRVRMQNLGLSIVGLSQGIPFFHAGSDMLRSKSLDRNSYNSSDWFNQLDFSYETTNWGIGLPPAADNQGVWDVMAPILAKEALTPSSEHILQNVAHFRELLQIRQSTPLFRLRTGEQVMERLVFHNTGEEQQPALIVMSISDMVGEELDPNYDMVVVLFNAHNEAQSFTAEAVQGLELALHPVLQASADAVVQGASFSAETGTFEVPARTTAVFILPQQIPLELVEVEDEQLPVEPPEGEAEPERSDDQELPVEPPEGEAEPERSDDQELPVEPPEGEAEPERVDDQELPVEPPEGEAELEEAEEEVIPLPLRDDVEPTSNAPTSETVDGSILIPFTVGLLIIVFFATIVYRLRKRAEE